MFIQSRKSFWNAIVTCQSPTYLSRLWVYRRRPAKQQNVTAKMRMTKHRRNTTVIVETFVRIKYSSSSVCGLSYAINFRTARATSHTLVHVYRYRMLQNFVLSAKSTRNTKLNRVRNVLRLQQLRAKMRTTKHRRDINSLRRHFRASATLTLVVC